MMKVMILFYLIDLGDMIVSSPYRLQLGCHPCNKFCSYSFYEAPHTLHLGVHLQVPLAKSQILSENQEKY